MTREKSSYGIVSQAAIDLVQGRAVKTKQEEIRNGILRIQQCEDDGGCPEDYIGDDPCSECRTNKLLDYLHSQGCVIKVDRGSIGLEGCDWLTESLRKEYCPLLKAGYVATIPIKED